MAEIERTPILQELEKFAQALQPEQRAKLFRTAEAFLDVGAMHGIFGALNPGNPGDQQKAYKEYLSRKVKEYSA
jgi:hypothetical protein